MTFVPLTLSLRTRLLLAGVLRRGVVDVGGAGAPVDHRLLGVHLQLP